MDLSNIATTIKTLVKSALWKVSYYSYMDLSNIATTIKTVVKSVLWIILYNSYIVDLQIIIILETVWLSKQEKGYYHKIDRFGMKGGKESKIQENLHFVGALN